MDISSNSLRAAIFGLSDGTVSTLGLLAGVVGAGLSSGAVLTSAIAGAIAGALSMSAGEYVSVRVQDEYLNHEDCRCAMKAAAANGGFFVAGAVIPILPFMFTQGAIALVWAFLSAVIALSFAGAFVTITTKEKVWRSGLRLPFVALSAGVISYLLGNFLSSIISI